MDMFRSTLRRMEPSTRIAIAYGATTFSATMLNSVFNLFYVDMFLKAYQMTDWWFYTGQIMYLIWNAVNDPLFGWLSDRAAQRKRVSAIRYGGPAWAVLFLLPWFRWSMRAGSYLTGLHYVVSLLCFDGLFTYVMLQHCALLADITNSAQERAKCNMYSAVFAMLGALPVFICTYVYDQQARGLFQIACLGVAALAWFGFAQSANNLHDRVTSLGSSPSSISTSGQSTDGPSVATGRADGTTVNAAAAPPAVGVIRLVWQIVTNRNFIAFVTTNFLQVQIPTTATLIISTATALALLIV
eukprot:TRINITY_DN9078_c0_g1_i3.p1 TRINITY_DN9078_c0_g1~~TRINITY_DN9078_c0_g1_i3.p1  ORF type:complete len:299 (-),score=51.47 TRINITY_DN9078_c0_g1_i3:607-1503(-)